MDPSTPAVREERVRAKTRAANGIYGLIVSSAVMVATPAQTVGHVAAAVLITLFVYWAAERYAHLMAMLVVSGPHPRKGAMVHDLRDGWEIVTASFLPLLVMVGVYALGASHSTAVTVALVFTTALLGGIGWRIARIAHLSLVGCLISTTAASAFGIVLIVLKTALH